MARAPRSEEITAERRRRDAGTLDRLQRLKLAVPDKVREDNPGYTFRWGNDTGNRLHALTVQDDWDKVEGVDPIPVDTTKEGKPIYAHLLKKRQEHWTADQKQKTDAIAEAERGRVIRGEANDAPEQSYAPGGNSISTGYTP